MQSAAAAAFATVAAFSSAAAAAAITASAAAQPPAKSAATAQPAAGKRALLWLRSGELFQRNRRTGCLHPWRRRLVRSDFQWKCEP